MAVSVLTESQQISGSERDNICTLKSKQADKECQTKSETKKANRTKTKRHTKQQYQLQQR